MDLLSRVADIASIIGLAASGLASFFASSAAKAAREAKREVRIGGAAERLRELNQAASELLDYIQAQRFEAAAVRARDLYSGIGSARQRWIRFLDSDAAAALDDAQARVGKISKALAMADAPPAGAAREKLVNYCLAAIQLLSKESNRILARVEQESEK